ELEGVEGAEDAVEAREVQLSARGLGAQVGLTELEAGADPQLRERGAAALDALDVAVDVEAGHGDQAVGGEQVALVLGEVLGGGVPGVLEVEVLGEEQRRHADADGEGAGGLHGAAGGGVGAAGVPGELAVHVAVCGEGAHEVRVAHPVRPARRCSGPATYRTRRAQIVESTQATMSVFYLFSLLRCTLLQ